jgi:ABC-type Fe3+-hydroxamate transport system substrate-binding protein
MIMLELTDEQAKVLLLFHDNMNWYEEMSILSKVYDKEEDADEIRKIITSIYVRLFLEMQKNNLVK